MLLFNEACPCIPGPNIFVHNNELLAQANNVSVPTSGFNKNVTTKQVCKILHRPQARSYTYLHSSRSCSSTTRSYNAVYSPSIETCSFHVSSITMVAMYLPLGKRSAATCRVRLHIRRSSLPHLRAIVVVYFVISCCCCCCCCFMTPPSS